MYGCGVIVVQNMVSLSNIFAVLHHWIPGSTNRHTIAMERAQIAMRKSLESVSLIIMIIMAMNLKLIRNQ